MDTVIETKAGKIDDCEMVSSSNLVKKKPCLIKLNNGSYINSHDFIRIIISGDCMVPRKILSGEEWLVKPIKKGTQIVEQISPHDILLIYLRDKNVYKIREFKQINANAPLMLDTFYYNSDGTIHPSSKPHSVNSVIGVVKYSI